MSMPRLLIDTDVGSDDAMALVICAAAELNGKAKIEGVTCVHGNTHLDNVCINTLKVLKTINRLDVPVYKGAESAILETVVRAGDIHGNDGFGDFYYPDPPRADILLQQEHAANYLVKKVSQNPGQLTLLTLGPLTNVALAIRLDPNFCKNVKEVVIMGGNSEGVGNITAAAEFNFFSDPEAAYIVIENMKCPITIFPYEAALRHGGIPYKWRKEVLGALRTPQMELLNKVERVILERELYGVWSRCDPIAAALAIDPAIIVEKSKCFVTVELHGQHTRGAMVVDHLCRLNKEPNVTVVKKIDIEEYKKVLMNAFGSNLTEKE
ncbi:nucleoside hydrolase [Anabrus simplex]|uniref:nucleoside hydrolase n=1 Tax=Anabrus simplex TaxID=316456 RepID=UPI0035A26F6B